MGRIYIFQTFLVILPSNGINITVLLLTLNRKNWHSIFEFLSVGSIIFRKIHIDIAGDSMPVYGYPLVSIGVVISIDHLLLNTILLSSITAISRYHGWVHCLLQTLCNFCLFIGIELFDFRLLFSLFFSFILILRLSNLIPMGFFKLQILSHCVIHIRIIDIDKNNLFSFLNVFIFIFQTKFLSKLFLK